ncbi:MAG: HMA2 domain-containing protein [Thauera sp.]
MNPRKTRIASSSPGRVRIRDLALRDHHRIEQFEAQLRRIEGIQELQSNPAAGSVVVLYDRARLDALELESRIDELVDRVLATPRSPARRSLRNRANRIAKVGMLGSLGASLALAATGNKRWHALSGGGFVACLGVHITLHRKALLR